MIGWQSTTPKYDPENDSIDLITADGEVVMRLHRNMIIKMVGMLPPNPPGRNEIKP